MAGINISLVSDVKSFLAGTKDTEKALDDVAGSLDGVAAAGDDATDKLEREFSDAAKKIKDSGQDIGKGIGDGVKDGAREASEGFAGVKESGKAAATETAASFDGSMESIIDGIQGGLAEAFEGFGPAGAAAGIVAAAGIGIVTKHLEDAKEKAQEAADKVAEIADTLIGIGSSSLGAEEVNDKLAEMAGAAEDGGNALLRISNEARAAGVSFRDASRGIAGDADAQKRSFDEVNSRLAELTKSYEDLQEKNHTQFPTAEQIGVIGQIKALQDLRGQLVDTNAMLDTGADVYNAYTQATAGSVAATEDQTKATDEQAEAAAAAQAKQDAYNASLKAAADPIAAYQKLLADKTAAEQDAAQKTAAATKDPKDSWEKYAKDVTVTIDDLIKDLDSKTRQKRDFEKNLKEIGKAGGQALADSLREQGPDAAGAIADVIAEADPKKQAKYIKKYGKAAGEETGKGIADGITSQKETVQQAATDILDGLKGPDVSVGVLAPTVTPTTATPQAPSPATVTGPITATLAPDDREALIRAATVPVAVTVNSYIDSTKVATAMRTIKRKANTSGRRP